MKRFLLCAFLTFAAPGMAQAELISKQGNAEADALYSQLMKDPTNRSLNLRYATLASRHGDFESAIPPLERLLLAAPDDAWLQLQLGQLYKALRSGPTAQYYLTRVVNNPKASADMVKQAKQELQQ
jgi:Flp pilus assembly protein TadD